MKPHRISDIGFAFLPQSDNSSLIGGKAKNLRICEYPSTTAKHRKSGAFFVVAERIDLVMSYEARKVAKQPLYAAVMNLLRKCYDMIASLTCNLAKPIITMRSIS